MLSLDPIKTRTIYSKAQINSLEACLKSTLNEAYETESPDSIQNLLLTIRLLYYLNEVPHFLKELNSVGEIQTLAQLQILFMKCSHWKSYKEVMQRWVAGLMGKIAALVKGYGIKPVIAAVLFEPGKEETDVVFFAAYLDRIAKNKNQISMNVSVSFLRVFLIDQLQNKRRQFTLAQKDQILPEWKTILQSLIKLCHDLQSLKYEQICVSICYWLCSQHGQFIKQCVMKGTVAFLCQTISNKNVSEWYGRKILSFLKLLLLGLEGKNQYFGISDIESCIAQFTLKYYNENILDQARSLFACMRSGQGKIEQQVQSYDKYCSQKNPKNLQTAIRSSRILFFYSEDDKVRKQLSQVQNLDYFSKLVKKEQNVHLLNQILNIVSYNSNKNRSQKEQENDLMAVERVSGLLTSSKDKNELLVNGKRLLISFIRMLKKLVQTRQFNEKLLNKIKSEGIVKKFSKFSDCTNFKYQRELLSLIRVLNSSNKNLEKSNESADIMKALVKHMNENLRRTGKRLEDDLEQLELIYEMLQRGQSENISQEVINNILKKIKLKKSDVQEVQISILDRSEQQANRQLTKRINNLAIRCLQKLQQNKKSQPKIPKEDIDKLLALGLSTDDPEELKTDAGYLILLNEHEKLVAEQKEKLKGVYRRYREMLGEDSELVFQGGNGQGKEKDMEKGKEIKEDRYKLNRQLIEKSISQELSQEQRSQLQIALLHEQDLKLRKEWLDIYSKVKQIENEDSLTIVLKYVLKEAQGDQDKKGLFDKFSQFLWTTFNTPKTSDPNQNLIFKILSQLVQQNLPIPSPFHAPPLPTTQTYFQNFLTLSYSHLTKQSLQFTNNALSVLQYKGTEQRQDQYWRYIYNTPEMIGREAAFLAIGGGDEGRGEKFWSFFGGAVEKNLGEERKFVYHFLELVGSKVSNQIWGKFQLQGIYEKLVEDLKQKDSEIHTKPPSQVHLRKLLRISKSLKSFTTNPNLDLSPNLPSLHSAILHSLSILPQPSSPSPKQNQLALEYTRTLLAILKMIYKRRDGFAVVRKELKGYSGVCGNLGGWGLGVLNQGLAEGFRVMLLRDDRHEEFQGIVKMWDATNDKIGKPITPAGAEHIRSCQQIITAVKSNNTQQFKSEYLTYFFPTQKNQSPHQTPLTFTDQQLLTHLKNLLNPPYQHGLNILVPHLKQIPSSQFSITLTQIFVQSAILKKDDRKNAGKSLEDVQRSIAESIWGPGCQLGGDFYKMIDMNLEGLRVCLRTKGLGVQGTGIVCEKFYEFPDEVPLCAEILHINVGTSKEWAVVMDKKIPELVNSLYKTKGQNEIYAKSLANLIGSSSKLKSIQNSYKIQLNLFQNLQKFSKSIPCLASTLYALSGLVYLNDGNQKILGTRDCIRYYLKIIETNSASSLIFEKGCNLLSNMVHKNTGLIPLYLQLKVQITVIQVATSLLYQHSPTKQFLRLIGNLSLSLQSSTSIPKTPFLSLWSHILTQAQSFPHEDIIKYLFDIVYNLLNYPEVEAKSIAYRVVEAGCVGRLVGCLRRNCIGVGIVEAGLDAVERMLVVDVGVRQAVDNGLLLCMEDIAKTQSWNQSILQKWLKVLYILTRNPELLKSHLLTTQVLSRMASFLKQHPELKPQSLTLALAISDLVYSKGQHELFVSSGYVDVMVQLLRNRYLRAGDASRIIDGVVVLHGEKVLTGGAYTKVFGGLMTRLEFQFRDENSKKIIQTLTKIRTEIQITARAASILLEFSYIFLTQSQILTSQKYHKRVREFICLLAYFLSSSLELKLIFKEEEFLTILRSWIKVDKSLDQDNSVSQACRVCIFAVVGEQGIMGGAGDRDRGGDERKEDVYEKLMVGKKCQLYRRDRSYKDAIIKLRKGEQTLQLISYKYPDGQIKQKYILPVPQTIILHAYKNNNDPLFPQSIFSAPKTIFQKAAIAENCLTVIGVIGEQLSVRQIDVEFQGAGEREEFVGWLRVAVGVEGRDRRG